MAKSGGVRDLPDIEEALEADQIQRIKVGGFDVDGVLRGKYISRDKLVSAARDGFGFCDVLFGWDVADELYEGVDVQVTGWHTGYPDALARLDLGTYRPIPWEPGTAALLCDFWTDPDTPHPACPRNMLKRVLRRADRLGFVPKVGAEYEFLLFDESPASLAEKGFRDLVPLDPGMFGYSWLRTQAASDLMHALIDDLGAFDVPLEGLHTETGPGVFEAAIAYGEALEAADRAALFKTAVKAVAAQHGLVATCMAKVNAELPGCSGHLHQSLWDAEAGANAFSDAAADDGMSETMRHFIGGQVALLPDITALVWPTINSYKRAVEGVWSPVNASWGRDNRTAAVRAITGPTATATRVEFRMSPADMNPYISIGASLAAGLHGVEQAVAPPPEVEGNAYDASATDCPPLPRTLDAAVRACRASATAPSLVGPEFLDHYLRTRSWEVRRFNLAVTDWELARYFEII
jgi:glutamine synthetase